MAAKPLPLTYPFATERIAAWHWLAVIVLTTGAGLLFKPVATAQEQESEPAAATGPASKTQQPAATAQEPESRPTLSDTEIANAVADQLFFDAAILGYSINTEVTDGIVTLTGQTSNLLARERAARIAETVKGVKTVINRIEVKQAADITDEAIRQQIRDSLIFNPRTESYEIEAEVNQRQVTLTGTVQSWQEKQFAERLAKSVKGVQSVDNQISITYIMSRTDNEIRDDVQGALGWDRYVDDSLIEVSVSDGAVTLTGTVGSAAERRRARANAWVNGVTSVDTSDLKVEYWARNEELRKGKYAAKPDSDIKSAIEKALDMDPRVAAEAIRVNVNDGIVTLRGMVDTLEGNRAAAQIARRTVGVWRVKNRLRVGMADAVGDEQLYRRVRDALVNDPLVEFHEITLTVNNGKVTLNGAVDSQYEKAQAEDVAARFAGVAAVNNGLTVANTQPLTNQPYVDDRYSQDYPWYDYMTSTTTSDWAIHDDIMDELWWSPFVDSDEITVTVNNGVATLTGTVDTWSERSAAMENALEAGAVRVINRLDVAYGPAAETR